MKKLIIAITILAVCSCSDEIKNLTEQTMPSVSTVNIINGTIVNELYRGTGETKTLAFRDNAAFESFKITISQMNEEDRCQYVSKYGIVSVYNLSKKADDELEEIGATSKNEKEFAQAYDALKSNYDGTLVSNAKDLSDLNLYVPASDDDEIYPFITGKNHKIVIGKEIIDLKFYDRVNKSDSLTFINTAHQSNMRRSRPTENEANWNVNWFIESDDGKKVAFNAYIDGDHVTFHFGAQKKMWYGWKRDNNRQLYFRLFELSGMTFDRFSAELMEMNNPDKTYWLGEYKRFGSIDLNVGNWINQGAPSMNSCNVTGKIYVWTDMTVDKDDSGNIIYYKRYTGDIDPNTGEYYYFTTSYPSLSNSKAYVCKLALTN